MMLARVADTAAGQYRCDRLPRCRSRSLVVGGGLRLEAHPPAPAAKAAKEIGLLRVKEESLVQAPYVVQRRPPHQYARTGEPIRRTRSRVRGRVLDDFAGPTRKRCDVM